MSHLRYGINDNTHTSELDGVKLMELPLGKMVVGTPWTAGLVVCTLTSLDSDSDSDNESG